MEHSIAYLAENDGPDLDPGVVPPPVCRGYQVSRQFAVLVVGGSMVLC